MWFKLSDDFHCHPKVIAAGNTAIGLWTRAASYSAAYELDGFVPAGWVKELGTHYTVYGALVKHALWVPMDGGWKMHDFEQYNPTAEQWRSRLEAERQRKRDFRERQTMNGHDA